MQIFNSTNNQNTFKYNGLTYPKNFMIIKQGDENISIHNGYDTKFQLLGSTHYSQVQVNGVIHTSQANLMASLASLLFAKQFNYVVQDINATRLITIGELSIDGNYLTVEPAEWLINGENYETTTNTVLTVPYCSSGKNRIDIILGNSSNQIIRIAGTETSGIAVSPVIPNDCVYITEMNVNDNTIDVSDPITGSLFVKKEEFAENPIVESGEYVIELNSESSQYRFMNGGSVDTVKGFNATSFFWDSLMYVGKEIKIVNNQETAITLVHNGSSVDMQMRFPTETDLILQPLEIALFKIVKVADIFIEFVGINRLLNEVATPTLQSVLNAGNEAMDKEIILSYSGNPDVYSIFSKNGVESYDLSGNQISGSLTRYGVSIYDGIIDKGTTVNAQGLYYQDSTGQRQIQFEPQSNTAGKIIFKNITGSTDEKVAYVSDLRNVTVTGGTYSNGTITLANNSGGTATISGLFTGYTGTTNLLPKFVTGNTFGNSFFYDNGSASGGGYSTGVSTVAFIRGGNSWMFLQRAQSNMDFILGNPGSGQPNIVESRNQIDGFNFYSDGVLRLFGGTVRDIGTQYEGLRVLTGGTIVLPTVPLAGTSSDSLLVRDVSGNVKTIAVSGITTGTDIRVTGGTYNQTTGISTFTNNTGGTFSLSGFTRPFTGGTVTGNSTFTNGLSASTISATTFTGVKRSIGLLLDGMGSTISVATQYDVIVPYNMIIQSWNMISDLSGNTTIDIWKNTFANYPPTSANTITASAKPNISASTKNQSSTLTGWNTTVSAGDIIRFIVDSCTGMTKINLILTGTEI